MRVVAGKAERHRQHGEAVAIVERRAVDAEPVSQPVAGAVVERPALGVDLCAGGLARYQHRGAVREPGRGARRMGGAGRGEACGATPAGRDFPRQRVNA